MAEIRPEWTLPKSTKRVWSEDDADVSTEGHETLDRAFLRIYKVPRPKPFETWDAGDATYKLLHGGVVIVDSYPGNSEIRELPVPEPALPGKPGTCCSCGFSGVEETPCLRRVDVTHCAHWWDGTDEENES